PRAAGAHATDSIALVPAAMTSGVAGGATSRKLPEPAPVIVSAVTRSAPVPPLDTVSASGADSEPTTTSPNPSIAGCALRAAIVAVPRSVTVLVGAAGSFDAIVSVACRPAVAVGADVHQSGPPLPGP